MIADRLQEPRWTRSNDTPSLIAAVRILTAGRPSASAQTAGAELLEQTVSRRRQRDRLSHLVYKNGVYGYVLSIIGDADEARA